MIGKEISFYQRLLARDDDEAGEVAQANPKALGATGVIDQIIIPALVLAARDESRREITAEDETFIVTCARDIFQHLPRPEPAGVAGTTVKALGIAAWRAQSELLLEMLAVQLAGAQATLELIPLSTPPAQALARVKLLSPGVVCVAALPPDGGPFARELCHQLKALLPDLTVMAFRPDEPGVDPARAAKRLKEAGADLVVATLVEASAELSRLLGPAPAASLRRRKRESPPSRGGRTNPAAWVTGPFRPGGRSWSMDQLAWGTFRRPAR